MTPAHGPRAPAGGPARTRACTHIRMTHAGAWSTRNRRGSRAWIAALARAVYFPGHHRNPRPELGHPTGGVAGRNSSPRGVCLMIDQLRGGRDRRPAIEAVELSLMESLGVGPSRSNACQARCLMVTVRTGPGTVGFDSQPFMLKPCRIASSRRH